MNKRMKREEKSREEKKEKNITRKKKPLLYPVPKDKPQQSTRLSTTGRPAGNLSQYQVNVEDKGKSRK